MSCNRIIQPVEFTKEQIAECEKCKHISGKKVWCCLFGLWIKEPERNRKIKYPSKLNMAKSLAKATVKQVRAGNPKRSEIEQARCMAICEKCEWYVKQTKVGPRCIICGCCMSLKTRWATAHCELGLW